MTLSLAGIAVRADEEFQKFRAPQRYTYIANATELNRHTTWMKIREVW